MVELPVFLHSFRQDAIQSIEQGLVKEIEFADATYQVLVEDLHTHIPCWVFLQLEGTKKIKDAFCSCEEHQHWDIIPPCVHLATAYLSLFGSHVMPLHQRFSRSLWNQLCRICADGIGDDPKLLSQQKAGSYIYKSRDQVIQFSIKAKSPEAIQRVDHLIAKRAEATEETSIKFSNLPEEELMLWHAGTPSPQLRYELSYWSDLAKWLILLQEAHKPYQIHFRYSSDQIPNWIDIHFDELELGFHIAEDDLPLIIPSLTTVNSPLEVHYAHNEGISHITYNKKTGTLHIEAEKLNHQTSFSVDSKNKRSISLEGWTYIPGKGFLAEEPHILLQAPVLEGEELSNVLTEYGRLISRFLIDCELHLNPVPVFYELSFDKRWNLHISSYLFSPGDLKEEDSRLIGDWAYVHDRGLYHLEGKRFEEVETIIPIHQVSDFINQNRAWLNMQEGFQTHVRSIEYQLTYTFAANDRLTFVRTLAKSKSETKQQDFGSWIYLEGHGFYPKSVSSGGFLVRPGISLSPEQIPLFIKMNRDELSVIPGFFSSKCPVIKSSLMVELTEELSVKVIPTYELLESYQNKKIKWFDDFVYVDGEGFYELPVNLRLPEKFRHDVELEGEDRDLFLLAELDGIRKYVSKIDPKLFKLQQFNLVAKEIAPAPDQGRGWYRFSFYYNTEKGLISVIDLWKVLKKKKNTFAFFNEGIIDLRNDLFNWIRHLKKERIETGSQQILLTTLEFMRLNAFSAIELLEEQSDQGSISHEILNELTQLRTPEEPDIGGLVSHLRPYQEIGVKWLWFLYHQQLSGLLCDDMGLGKTHQAMGLLVSIHNFYQAYAEGVKRYFLIVCPTSVIYHWQEKLEQFLPGLRVYTFYGSDRVLEDFHGQYDVLLTSYGILRNEKDVLSKIPFEVAIFDEIQIAKNQASRVYGALTKVQAQMKIGLSGTPIENYLRELKSLFDIVLPSYMPGEAEYRELFIRPIEKEDNRHRKDLLNRLIRPFILRRKKEDVLTDLPEKIEEIAHCDLSIYQRKLYMEVLQQRRRHLMQELEDKNNPIPYLHIFALLSSLKQICDHPAVYLKKFEDYEQYESGKWSLFCELLREARESNQKVVVFSQYLGMLDIIEHYLSKNEIGYASIRGATQNRKDQIKRFNNNPKCEVFVGSLQAAGLGVDLTAGSVVIHYDRWWNAARENQATDRVHRIGQTRGVQVFKLVTKNTFEEKIDAMILRKGQLMEDVIGVDEQDTLKRFSREDLMELLSFVESGEEHLSVSDVE